MSVRELDAWLARGGSAAWSAALHRASTAARAAWGPWEPIRIPDPRLPAALALAMATYLVADGATAVERVSWDQVEGFLGLHDLPGEDRPPGEPVHDWERIALWEANLLVRGHDLTDQGDPVSGVWTLLRRDTGPPDGMLDLAYELNDWWGGSMLLNAITRRWNDLKDHFDVTAVRR